MGKLLSILSALVFAPSVALAQQWSYASERDPFGGTGVFTASVSLQRGSAFVRCKDERLETVFAPWFSYIGQETADVRYKFSGGDVEPETWNVAANGSAVFAKNPAYFARKLAGASSLALDLYDRTNTPNRLIIPLGGSGAAIARVLRACNIPVIDPAVQDDEVDFWVASDLDALSITQVRTFAINFEVQSSQVRPLELYRKLSSAYRIFALEGCLNATSSVYEFGYCTVWRNKKQNDPSARFQLSPLELVAAWHAEQSKVSASQTNTGSPRLPAASVHVPSICRDPPTQARALGPFNVERAYPQRAIDRGEEGTVTAMLQIGEGGNVAGVIITAETPPGIFGAAVEREARRMKYAPARLNCENIADTVPLVVNFSRDLSRFPQP